MPEQKTLERARKKGREGRSPSTQAGEFVREEMEHIRQGKHGATSTKQAIAIGLSKARKAGVALPPRGKKSTSGKIRRPQNRPSARRSQAILEVLKRKPHSAASHRALSAQSHRIARQRGPSARHQAAMKAVGKRTEDAQRGSHEGCQNQESQRKSINSINMISPDGLSAIFDE